LSCWSNYYSSMPWFPALPQVGEQRQGIEKPRRINNHKAKTDKNEELPEEKRTTVMLKNLPNDYTSGMVMELLYGHNFKGKFDFLYVPHDFKRKANFGYAFVNFVSNTEACRAWSEFRKFCEWEFPSHKSCDVAWTPTQGKYAHVRRYRDSPVMHPDIPAEYKPMIFDENGNQVEFPKPVRAPQMPRFRKGNNVW